MTGSRCAPGQAAHDEHVVSGSSCTPHRWFDVAPGMVTSGGRSLVAADVAPAIRLRSCTATVSAGCCDPTREDAPMKVEESRGRMLMEAMGRREFTDVVTEYEPQDRLVDDLWDGEPPATARHTLQGYVYRLRHALGRDAWRLMTRAPGYQLKWPRANSTPRGSRTSRTRATGCLCVATTPSPPRFVSRLAVGSRCRRSGGRPNLPPMPPHASSAAARSPRRGLADTR